MNADTASTDSTSVRQVTSREARGRAWSAIGFAVLYFVGLVPLGDLLGSFGDPDAAFVGAAVFVFFLGSSVMGLLGVPVWAFAVGVHWFRRRPDVRLV